MTTPAVAVAASICWLARQKGLPTTGYELKRAVVERHPDTCDWCDWPLDDLLRMVKELDHDSLEVRRFSRESRDEQRRLVAEAQGGTLL